MVTGGKRYSIDLPQGGLENPYKPLFSGKHDEINKLECLLFCKATLVNNKVCFCKAMSV